MRHIFSRMSPEAMPADHLSYIIFTSSVNFLTISKGIHKPCITHASRICGWYILITLLILLFFNQVPLCGFEYHCHNFHIFLVLTHIKNYFGSNPQFLVWFFFLFCFNNIWIHKKTFCTWSSLSMCVVCSVFFAALPSVVYADVLMPN